MWQVRGLAHTERIPMCGSEKERERERERDKERDGTGQSGSGSSTTFSPASGLGMFPTPPAQVTTSPQYNGPLRLPQLPHMPHISFTDRQCSSPLPRRKQVSACLAISETFVNKLKDQSQTKLLLLGPSQSLQLLWKTILSSKAIVSSYFKSYEGLRATYFVLRHRDSELATLCSDVE